MASFLFWHPDMGTRITRRRAWRTRRWAGTAGTWLSMEAVAQGSGQITMIKTWINRIFFGGDSLTALQSPPFKVSNRQEQVVIICLEGSFFCISLESSHDWVLVAWVLFIAQLAHHTSENTISSGGKSGPQDLWRKKLQCQRMCFSSVMPELHSN